MHLGVPSLEAESFFPRSPSTIRSMQKPEDVDTRAALKKNMKELRGSGV